MTGVRESISISRKIRCSDRHYPGFNAGAPFRQQPSKNNKKGEKKIMARERMVTRTVTQTTAKVMCLDVITAEVSFIENTIGGTYTEVDLLKKFKKLYETDEFKVVHVESLKVEDILLGMTEEDFIRYATVLPPRKQQGD